MEDGRAPGCDGQTLAEAKEKFEQWVGTMLRSNPPPGLPTTAYSPSPTDRALRRSVYRVIASIYEQDMSRIFCPVHLVEGQERCSSCTSNPERGDGGEASELGARGGLGKFLRESSISAILDSWRSTKGFMLERSVRTKGEDLKPPECPSPRAWGTESQSPWWPGAWSARVVKVSRDGNSLTTLERKAFCLP